MVAVFLLLEECHWPGGCEEPWLAFCGSRGPEGLYKMMDTDNPFGWHSVLRNATTKQYVLVPSNKLDSSTLHILYDMI